MRCVSPETLTGVWIEDSEDGDFADESVQAPPFDGANPNHYVSALTLVSGGCIGVSVSMKRLLVLICSAEDCFGDGHFDWCLPCSGLFAASLQLMSLSLLLEWLVLLLFCSLMFSPVAWMVEGRLDAAICSLVCWTFYLWYVVDCLGAVEGPPGFSLAWFTLHHLYRMLLLLIVGSWLVRLGHALLPEAFSSLLDALHVQGV